jgi:starvation-inducible outer membrane lipoprotein
MGKRIGILLLIFCFLLAACVSTKNIEEKKKCPYLEGKSE